MKIVSSELTTCEVKAGGSAIQLNLLDIAGEPVSIQFPLDQAESIVISFPQLLSRAVVSQTQDPDAQYIFPVGIARVERMREQPCLVITLSTLDGFEIPFVITLDDGKKLATTLCRHTV